MGHRTRPGDRDISAQGQLRRESQPSARDGGCPCRPQDLHAVELAHAAAELDCISARVTDGFAVVRGIGESSGPPPARLGSDAGVVPPDPPGPAGPQWSLTGDCKIEFPPPPSGEVNPDLPALEIDTLRNLGPGRVDGPRAEFGLAAAPPQAAAGLPSPAGGADRLKAPPKPLCPEGWDFDYWYQSCWPESEPPPPPSPGTQWKHACLCPPDHSWMARERECWRRGEVPVGAFLRVDALTGYDPGPARAGGLTSHDPAYVPMPYRTFRFEGSLDRVRSVFNDKPHVWEIDKIWRIGASDPLRWRLEDRCHAQGIAHCGDMIVTSCMTKGYSEPVESRFGCLQFYPYGGIHEFADVFQDAANAGQWNQRVLGQPWPHAVVGQSIRGTVVTNELGVLQPQFDGHFLFPVGSEDSGMPPEGDLRSNVRIYDQLGKDFPSMEGFSKTGYACGALFSYKLAGDDHERLFLLFLDEGALSLVYYPWDGIALRFGPGILKIDGFADPLPGAPTYDSLLNPGHQAINFFYADGLLYLIGTHDRWMDTYRIDIIVSDGTYTLAVDKIANCKFPVTDATGGLFDEGVAIQPLENNKMRVWCAPYDYRAGRCIPAEDESKCTHLWYFERRL